MITCPGDYMYSACTIQCLALLKTLGNYTCTCTSELTIINAYTVRVNKKLPFPFRAVFVSFLFCSSRKHVCFIVRVLIISVFGVAR